MFFALSPHLNFKKRGLMLSATDPENPLKEIKLIHYSGDKKPWDFESKFQSEEARRAEAERSMEEFEVERIDVLVVVEVVFEQYIIVMACC